MECIETDEEFVCNVVFGTSVFGQCETMHLFGENPTMMEQIVGTFLE